jgi:F420-non-reducing hydrogenase iron-sulfur subunit
VLEIAGIEPQRVLLEWVSSAEAQRFADVATSIVDTVSELGPLDRTANDLALAAARRTLDGEFVRWTVGKETALTSKGDVYGRSWDLERFEAILDSIAGAELEKNLIYEALSRGCTSVRDVASMTGMELARISFVMADMERTGTIEFKGMVDHKPQFAAV